MGHISPWSPKELDTAEQLKKKKRKEKMPQEGSCKNGLQWGRGIFLFWNLHLFFHLTMI